METVPAVGGTSYPQRPKKRTRPWTAIPADLDESPVGAAIGDAGIAALFRLSAWSTRYETDGVIPRTVAMRCGTAAALAGLERSGLIRFHSDSALVVGFLDVNLSHAERQAERDRWSTRSGGVSAGASSGVSAGASSGASTGDSGATGQDRTAQDVTSTSAPSERPAADATGASETKPNRGKGKTRQPTSEAKEPRSPSIAQAIWDYHAKRYLARHGEKPLPQSHFFVQLDRRVKAGLTLEQGRARVDRYFDSPPFALRDGARDFGRLLARWDMLAPEGPTLAERMGEGPPPIYVDPRYREEPAKNGTHA